MAESAGLVLLRDLLVDDMGRSSASSTMSKQKFTTDDVLGARQMGL